MATGISFAVFGIGGLFLTVTVFPLINLKSENTWERKKLTRKVIHKSFRLFINMMSSFKIIDFKIKEAEDTLKDQKGKVIIANHPTLIDIVVLISMFPHADCIVKQALWHNPFLKGVVTAADYIKNDDNIDSLMSDCDKSLKSGYLLIIFPEGTRTRAVQEMKLQRGASNIALRCRADIIPVTIRCYPSTLTKNEPWYSIPEGKAEFSMFVGKPIEVNNFIKENQSLSISARLLTNTINDYYKKEMKIMHKLIDEIKLLIIESLELEDMTIDDIETEEALFGEGLGLDSIDALELGLALKKKYAIVLDSNSEDSKKHFYSVASLSALVNDQRK